MGGKDKLQEVLKELENHYRMTVGSIKKDMEATGNTKTVNAMLLGESNGLSIAIQVVKDKINNK